MKHRFIIGITSAVIIALVATWWIRFRAPIEPQMESAWPLQWDHTPAAITSECNAAQSRLSEDITGIAGIAPDSANWTSVLSFERALEDLSLRTNRLSFYNSIHPDKAHRDAAQACSKAIGKLYVDIFTRPDLYAVIKTGVQHLPAKDKAAQLLAEDFVRAFKHNGLDLSPEKRDLLVAKRKKIIDLSSEYRERLADWSETIKLSQAELAGLPESFVQELEKDGDKFIVTLKYPHYYPFMDQAKDAGARRKMEEKFMRRGGSRNRDIMQEVLKLRVEIAQLLGYPTHAHFKLEDRMARSPEKVAQFLDQLIKKLVPRAKQDLAAMIALKQKDTGNSNVTSLEPWDWRYYANQVKELEYSVNDEQLSEYFPLNRVLAGMFEVYETIFDVRFVEVVDAPKWHPSVRSYAVQKSGSSEPIAYFFMDLYPREGKYGHAAAFTLVSGRSLPDQHYQKPISAIVANFTPPTETRPSLLKHSEVETLFHEFGHIMHQVLTTAKFGSQSGSQVKRDFVEAPSQMLENWVWKKESLAKLSRHYKTDEPIPDDLVERLLISRNANIGIKSLRQAFLAKVDQKFHSLSTPELIDTTSIWAALQQEIMQVGIPQGTYPEASFGHLIGGYDAGYYGYLWSEVYAQDMFTKFEQNGLFDTKTGREYVKKVLQPGGSAEPDELIEAFLGRPANQEAFLKSLGIAENLN